MGVKHNKIVMNLFYFLRPTSKTTYSFIHCILVIIVYHNI